MTTNKLKIFTFPYSGALVNPYKTLESKTAKQFSFFNFELPGHGSRITEPLSADIDALVEDCADKICLSGEKKYILFGHSLGCIFAFEVAKKLFELNNGKFCLVLSGRRSPNVLPRNEISKLPDDQFLSEIVKLGGIDKELLVDLSFKEFYLPIVKNDFILSDKYFREPTKILDFPVYIINGDRDASINKNEIERWSEFFVNKPEFIETNGNHFYYLNNCDDIIKIFTKCYFSLC